MDEHYAPSGGLQERRQCARSARITIFSVAQEPRDGESGEELSRHMVWLRITAAARHAGCHSVANLSRAQEQGAAAGIRFQVGLRTGEGEGSSGQSTALTRRGLMAVLLS